MHCIKLLGQRPMARDFDRPCCPAIRRFVQHSRDALKLYKSVRTKVFTLCAVYRCQ